MDPTDDRGPTDLMEPKIPTIAQGIAHVCGDAGVNIPTGRINAARPKMQDVTLANDQRRITGLCVYYPTLFIIIPQCTLPTY